MTNLIHCPAYDGPCGPGCCLRTQCETNPEKVQAFMERLDEQTTAALHTLLHSEDELYSAFEGSVTTIGGR